MVKVHRDIKNSLSYQGSCPHLLQTCYALYFLQIDEHVLSKE